MIVTYTIHDRAGIKGNDVTVTVRSDGEPDEQSVFWMVRSYVGSAPLPLFVPHRGITVQEISDDNRLE